MDLAFNCKPEILIGADTLSMAGTVCKRRLSALQSGGSRIMVAADHFLDSTLINRLKEILIDSGLDVIIFDRIEEGAGSAGIEIADNIAELSQAAHCDAIIGFGGRKAQTIARIAAITAAVPQKISAFDLIDGKVHPLDMSKNDFLPFISIPLKGPDAFTFTDYFIVSDPRSRLIKTVQSPAGLYAAVIIDNSLYTFLKSVSGAGFIFEGFSSAVEAYCSSKSSFLSDPLLERAISLYVKMFKGGANLTADNFVQTSFLTSLGASASSPGATDALASAISTRFPVTKQQCTAALFPLIAEKLAASRPEKMARVAAFMGAGKASAGASSVAETAAASVSAIRSCMEPMGLQASLKDCNISIDKAAAALEAARNLDFIAASPWIVSEEEVFAIIKQII